MTEGEFYLHKSMYNTYQECYGYLFIRFPLYPWAGITGLIGLSQALLSREYTIDRFSIITHSIHCHTSTQGQFRVSDRLVDRRKTNMGNVQTERTLLPLATRRWSNKFHGNPFNVWCNFHQKTHKCQPRGGCNMETLTRSVIHKYADLL